MYKEGRVLTGAPFYRQNSNNDDVP
jgi:hypothetical protein